MQTEIYQKNSPIKISPYLYVNEVACKCSDSRCHYTLFHPRTNHSFHLFRQHVNYPLTISSGFRCKTHNKKVGGVENSKHTTGMAVDIICPDHIPIKKFSEMGSLFFDVVLVYEKESFIHCHNN